MAAGRTPVTVLSGALGAGKTTLLRHVLEQPHGYRVAVIQNEFSEEMGIESPLITDAKGERFQDIYELPNGCLCCSARDGLISMLDRLLEERQRFDYVLVEATGTADPESICEIFWVDEGLGCQVYLDGVVTLVDGRNALSTLGGADADGGDAAGLGLEAEAEKQVACADVLVLNKADLAPEAQRARVAARLAAVNPTALLLESVYASVPLGQVLGIRAFDRGRLAESLGRLGPLAGRGLACGTACGSPACSSPACGAICGACGEAEAEPASPECAAVAGHGIDSLLLRGEGAARYEATKVRAWLADVLWEGTAGGVYRCKGLFQGPGEAPQRAAGDPTPATYALQGVGKLFEIEEVPGVLVSQSKFLFIGRGLRRQVLEAGLHGCLWQAREGGP